MTDSAIVRARTVFPSELRAPALDGALSLSETRRATIISRFCCLKEHRLTLSERCETGALSGLDSKDCRSKLRSADLPRSITRDLQRIGLTAAQARIAELVGLGMSVKQAAEELGIVESTARVQLKAVFARLGISRQSELAILVTKLGALVAATLLQS